MYPDFAAGIVIGTLLGVFVSATLWAVLFHQVQEIRRREHERELLAAAFRTHTPARTS